MDYHGTRIHKYYEYRDPLHLTAFTSEKDNQDLHFLASVAWAGDMTAAPMVGKVLSSTNPSLEACDFAFRNPASTTETDVEKPPVNNRIKYQLSNYQPQLVHNVRQINSFMKCWLVQHSVIPVIQYK